MWFLIVLGCIVVVVMVIVVLGVIGFKVQKREAERNKQEKNKRHELMLIGAQNVLDAEQRERSSDDYRQEIYKKDCEIGDYARKERDSCRDVLYKLQNELEQIKGEVDKKLSDFDRYCFGKNIDTDFEQLLTIFRRKKDIADKEYLTALQKCQEKKYPLTKDICVLESKRKKLCKEKEILEIDECEWNYVYLRKEREIWKNPFCEKFYNIRQNLHKKELIMIETELKENPAFKEQIEKFKRWEKYSFGGIVVFRESQALWLGRNGDTVAIWDSDNYQGQEIPIESVAYFQIDTQMQTRTQTLTSVSSTNGASKLGTAINEAIWGTAAATASAMQKNQQNTNTHTSSLTEISKTATIFFNYETGIAPLKVSSSNVDRLIAMMPEKLK